VSKITRPGFAVFLVLFFLSVSAKAQQTPEPNQQQQRPKIGLVLSGGGAKGVAHIGVLKAMEEAGLTPDYITGTSMGSIMGGLYSIGYSADEMAEIVYNIDWDRVLTNKIPLDKVTIEEKDYYGRYLLDFSLKNKKLQFPSGVIDGQALIELFSEKTRPVHDITDFNKFPIPFACVATNIVTGEPVVLNKGSLATAMRASMAIPTVFTPVKIDGNLLVDGGLVRNMPVDEVLAMGADIVIGVFVSSDLNSEKELTSLVSILSQSAFITSAFDTREQLKKCNILIEPNLEGFSTGSFHESPAILERGMEAGKAYYEIFKNLADSIKQIGPLHKVVKPAIQESYVFDQIEIVGNKVITNDFITGKMKFKPGKELSIKELNKRIEMTYGTQYFDRITYEIHGEPGHRTLKLNVVERPNIQFRFSYYYDSENKGGIIANATFRNVVLNSSRLIFEANLSAQPKIFIDYFKYLGKEQNFAFGLSGLYNKNEFPFYNNEGVRTSVYNSDYISGVFKLQSTNLLNSTYGVELKWSDILLNPKVGVYNTPVFPDYEINRIKYSSTVIGAFYRFNNLNDRYFPTRGMSSNIEATVSLNANGKFSGNDEVLDDYFTGLIETNTIKGLEADIIPVIPISKKIAILSKAKLKLSSLSDNKQNVTEFDFIGGFTPDLVNANEYYGAGIKEYYLANYFYGRLGAQYEVFRNLFVQAHCNVATTEFPVSFLNPNVELGDMRGKSTRIGYAAMIGMKSVIGPIKLAVAKDHYRNDWKASLIIGFHY
jgi:NTE family protein